MNLQMLKKAMLAYVSAVKFIWSSMAYPLSIVGKKFMNLRGYRVYGNSVQDGTPTPDNPVEIESVGDLTEKNLFDKDKEKYNVFINSDTVTSNSSYYTIFIDVENISNFTISIKKEIQAYYGLCDSIEVGSEIYEHNYFGTGITRTVTNNTHKYVGISIYYTNISAFDDVQIEEGTTATEYEPYHKYKIPVVARGWNLLPTPTFSTFTKNGVKFTNNKDGSITINGTPTAYMATPIMYLPDSTLEILRNNICVLTGFHNYEKNIGLVLSVGLNGSWVKYIYLNLNTYANFVKVDLRSIEFDKIAFLVRSEKNNVLINNLTVKPLLEVGTTMPTSFEPYITPVTTNIFLDEPLRKVGDYADYVDFEKQKVVRNISKYIFTGDENISIRIGEDRAVFYFPQILNKYGNNNKNFIPHSELCNRYQQVENVSTLTPLKISLSDCIYICDYYLTAEEYQAQLKNWYSSESPLIMYYALATPTEETVKLPTLPQFKGTTIYEVQTNIKPSGIEAKYC